jgi:hypothetical protein
MRMGIPTYKDEVLADGCAVLEDNCAVPRFLIFSIVTTCRRLSTASHFNLTSSSLPHQDTLTSSKSSMPAATSSSPRPAILRRATRESFNAKTSINQMKKYKIEGHGVGVQVG